MMNSLKLAAIAALALASTSASAQYMPHLDPQLYANVIMQMTGAGTCGPMPDKEIDEARLPAPGLMQGYFEAAQSGSPIAPHFKLNSKTRWTLGETSVGEEALNAQKDPLAVAGNRLDLDTVRFFRAGTHQTAQGQWLVLNEAGDVAGVYNGVFERQKGQWRLHKLEIFEADHKVAPIMHYCSKPGDLDERRVTGLKAQVEALEKRVVARTKRYERDVAKFEEAEARAAERPGSTNRARKLRERRTLMDGRRAKLAEAQEQLANARSNLAEAVADLEQLRSHTTEARNAHRFRELDLEGKPIEQLAADS
jgi:hypothetical protein